MNGTAEQIKTFMDDPKNKAEFDKWLAFYQAAIQPELDAIEESQRITSEDLSLMVY